MKVSTKPVVCQVATVNYVFDTRMFHKECKSLVQAGFDVHLVAVYEQDAVIDGVRIHALPDPPNRFARIVLWPWLAYKKILGLRPKPHIIQFHDPGFLPVGVALRLKGFKVIYDVHENQVASIQTKPYMPKVISYPISWIYRAIEMLATSGMGTVHVLESIAKNYRQPRVVVHNFPNVKERHPETSNVFEPPWKLIYAGGVSPDRGTMRMIRLLEDLLRKGLDVNLQIVGRFSSESHQKEVLEYIEENALNGRVEVTGRLPWEQCQEAISRAHIGLCLLDPTPNYTNSLALKILEYMLYEVPVIASDFPVWRPYVLGAGAGIQVDVSNPGQIADTVERLLLNPDRIKAMGRLGREAVLAKYCWENEVEKLIAFYGRMLSGRPAKA